MNQPFSRRKLLRILAASLGLVTGCQASKNIIPVTGQNAGPTEAKLPFLSNPVLPTSTPTPTRTPTPTPTKTPTTAPTPVPGASIIADHTIVDHYQAIPQNYIDIVKTMWVDIPGESHSYAYRKGCVLLAQQDSRFAVNVTEGGTPEGPTNQHMRISRATWGDADTSTGWIYNYGEEDWFTNATAIQRTKAHLTYCNTHNLAIAAMGFAWCWDMARVYGDGDPEGGIDPVYKTRWAGMTEYSPDGIRVWGLNAEDYALTGNHVCMDTYLDSVHQYINHCQANNYPTKVFFTTGPVDHADFNLGEAGYQREVKHEYMRNHVRNSTGLILFDYADILCWSNAGQLNTKTWVDYAGVTKTYTFIHDDNMLDLNGGYSEDGDHIGERGALRLAKALWWMLARMAGWNGV